MNRRLACGIAFAAVSTVLTGISANAQDGIYTEIYQPNSRVSIQWCTEGNNVRFQMQDTATGWIGLGFSNNQSMPTTDIIMLTGEGNFQDAYASARSAPAKDSQQDVTLISATQASGKTTVEFSRPIVTGDSKDFSLDTGRYVLWAYSSSSDSFAQQHSAEGASSTKIDFSAAAACHSLGFNPDLNNDGTIDLADVNDLLAKIRAGDIAADANEDSIVDTADISAYMVTAFNSYLGDANLDGQFGSGDLVTVFTAGQYEDAVALNSSWETGDWNGDQEFGTSDLVFAFQEGGYEQGPRPAVAAVVPEPSGMMLLVLSLFAAVGVRRCR